MIAAAIGASLLVAVVALALVCALFSVMEMVMVRPDRRWTA
jgi:hypothetical protein